VDHDYMQAIVIVPEEIVEQLPSTGRVRVDGTLNGAPFNLAVQRTKNGTRYLSAARPLRKAARVDFGDEVEVSMHVVDNDKLDVPEELQALLDVDEDARVTWERMTVGKRRGVAHYVNSVKNTDSRIRRAIEIMATMRQRLS
jgi:uncharacterized protein YdeI (YjbR/CyaY-like superfamily)